MDTSPPSSDANLGWSNVGIGVVFVVVNAVLSNALQLHIEGSLAVAALRCIVQLAFVATILQRVFDAQNPWAVAGITRASFFFVWALSVTTGMGSDLERRQ
jgi:ABC-type iron transport system FetAB permease component